MMTRCDIVAQGDRPFADAAPRILGEPGALPEQVAVRPGFVSIDQGYGQPALRRQRSRHGLAYHWRTAVLPIQKFSGKEPKGLLGRSATKLPSIGPSRSHMKDD